MSAPSERARRLFGPFAGLAFSPAPGETLSKVEPRWLSDVEVTERAMCRYYDARSGARYCAAYCDTRCLATVCRDAATAVIVALRARHRMLINAPGAPLLGFDPHTRAPDDAEPAG